MKFRFVNKLFILKQFKCVQTWSKTEISGCIFLICKPNPLRYNLAEIIAGG